MAFGRSDCDEIYEKHVLPTLDQMDIVAIRVDRSQHKDDLNNYIIKMLNEADIVLADLTYARPSVYYEAGYAERTIPVVYTVRRDHLSRSQPDDRFLVHFDLEMKKIVAWSDPEDHTFSKRLRERLNYFLGPLRRERDKQSKLSADRAEFNAWCVASRCEHICKVFSAKLKSKRFWMKPLMEIHRRAAYELAPGNGIIAAKMLKNTCHLCFGFASESITKKKIETALSLLRGPLLVSAREEAEEYLDYYFFCSLTKIPESRLTSVFPRAHRMEATASFRLQRGELFSGSRNTAFIYFLPEIDSRMKLARYLTEAVSQFDDRKTNRYTCAVHDLYGLRQIQFTRKKSAK
jgi:nucleoside 2-deoxyribosyltransferase